MKKNIKLNQWLWRWHFIAGLIVLPFVVVLTITGGIYLFKDNYETPKYKTIKEVEVTTPPTSFQDQWQLAKKSSRKHLNAMVVPKKKNQATEFISGQFSHKNSVFINPYTNSVSGTISPKNSKMNTVRKPVSYTHLTLPTTPYV